MLIIMLPSACSPRHKACKGNSNTQNETTHEHTARMIRAFENTKLVDTGNKFNLYQDAAKFKKKNCLKLC